MEPHIERLGVHIALGLLVRSIVIGVGLRYVLRRWIAWQQIATAALSPVLLRALFGEAMYSLWHERPLLAQIAVAPTVVLLQVVTIALLTDHDREVVTFAKIMFIAVLAQVAAHFISGPASRALLGG